MTLRPHAHNGRTSSVPRTSFHTLSGVDLSRLVLCCAAIARVRLLRCARGSLGAAVCLWNMCLVPAVKLGAKCSFAVNMAYYKSWLQELFSAEKSLVTRPNRGGLFRIAPQRDIP